MVCKISAAEQMYETFNSCNGRVITGVEYFTGFSEAARRQSDKF